MQLLQVVLNFGLVLAQNDREKKLTVLYLTLFFLFLMLLLIDSRTKKEFTGPKVVKNTVIALIFITAIVLMIAYFRL